jgi:FkbM family methyltransferase
VYLQIVSSPEFGIKAGAFTTLNFHDLNRLWLWKRPVKVFGQQFRAPTLDRLASLWMHKLGVLGRFEIQLLYDLVRRGMTVVDVGANQGIYTLILANLARPGRVFAFEPEPMLFRQLVANVQANKADNVVCQPIAISRQSGRLSLQSGKMHSGNNRIVRQPRPDSIEVTAASLDELFAGKVVDFLKIDVQGWEAEAFVGAKEVLRQNRDIILMFELWPYGLRTAGSEPVELLRFLASLGFSLRRIKQGKLVQLDQDTLPDRSRKLAYWDLIGTRNAGILG